MKLNISNLLTLARILVIPIIVVCIYLKSPFYGWIAFVLFCLASITDYFDGYIARKLNQITDFGTFLDPISDKIFVASVLILLVAFERITGVWIILVIIIFAREFLISGLREFLGPKNIKMPVSLLAKWKTTAQILAIGFLLVGDASPEFIPSILIGDILLWIAGIVTVQTGYIYLRTGLKHLD